MLVHCAYTLTESATYELSSEVMLFGLCRLSWTSDSNWESQEEDWLFSSDLLKLFISSILHLGQLRTLFGVCKKRGLGCLSCLENPVGLGSALRLHKSLGWIQASVLPARHSLHEELVMFWITFKVSAWSRAHRHTVSLAARYICSPSVASAFISGDCELGCRDKQSLINPFSVDAAC